jgi:hypothetical protein
LSVLALSSNKGENLTRITAFALCLLSLRCSRDTRPTGLLRIRGKLHESSTAQGTFHVPRRRMRFSCMARLWLFRSPTGDRRLSVSLSKLGDKTRHQSRQVCPSLHRRKPKDRGHRLHETAVNVMFTRISVLACCLLAAACGKTILDPQKYSEIASDYMSRPLHKALFICLEAACDFKSPYTWAQSDIQLAIEHARSLCQDYARQKGVDPNRCVPVYIDENQMLDITPYTAPR